MTKLYIKTYGCQMNEYDSDKMADVLRACGGMEQTDKPEEADIILFNTCSIREKAEEKVFSDLGRARELKQNNPNLLIGVGGCVASQEGETIVKRAPYVDVVFGPQTLHRLPQLIAARRESGESASGYQFPRDRKVRPCADSTDDPWLGICLHHGRLQQILHVLRGALYARRRDVAPVRRCDARSGKPDGTGRGRDHAAGAERECLSGRDGRWRHRRFRISAAGRCGVAGRAASALYHLASARNDATPDRSVCDHAQAGQPSASAGAVRVRIAFWRR